MTYLLDTDHITIMRRESDALRERVIRRYEENADETAVSIVSYHEQTMGAHASIQKAKTASQLQIAYGFLEDSLDWYTAMTVVKLDTVASALFKEFEKLGLRVKTMDLRIAAIARRHTLTVVTRNQRDFSKVPGLQLVDWTKDA